MRSLFDYVFIEIEGTLYNEDSGFKGVNGANIKIDPSYDPQYHVKIKGKVVSIPEELSQRPISQETSGVPSSMFTRNFIYKRREDIVPEVKIGDIVYFHFNTLASEDGSKNRIKGNIYKVAYENILCAIRNGEIIMIGGYCLIEPDLDTWLDRHIPVYEKVNGEVLIDRRGQPVMKPKSEWIVAKLEPEAKALTGFVVNVGTPLKNTDTSIKVGDKILYRPNADWRVKIEGNEYLVIRQRHIIAHKRKK